MPYQPTWNNPYLQGAPYQVPQTPTVQHPMPYQPFNGIIKVNGRDSAMQCQLPPNSTSQPLFNNNGKTFYIVTTDGTGAKTVEEFDFAPHEEEPAPEAAAPDYVMREEFEELARKVEAAMGALDGVHATVPAAATATDPVAWAEPVGAPADVPQGGARRHARAAQQPVRDQP